jgi:phenylalanyl-tRNA synthetase beta subunit
LPEPSQAQITAKNNSAAAAAARAYCAGNGLGEIAKLELTDVSGDIESKFKDETVAFFVEFASDPYKHPGRVIVLTRDTGGEWEIISEE